MAEVKKTNLLVLAPHFDDEVLLCGGTIHKLSKNGKKIVVAGFTESEQAWTAGEKKQPVVDQAKDVQEILGHDEVRLVQAGIDMKLDKLMLWKQIIYLIRELKPEIVIATHPNDFHKDHRETGVIAKEAVYQAVRKGILGSKEEIREPVLLFARLDLEGITPMKNEVYSILTKEDVAAKQKALDVYSGFIDEHRKSASGGDWVFVEARRQGMHTGTEFAEVFEIGSIRPMIRLEDLLS